MESLPFKIKDLYYSFAEAIGLANFVHENLVLEFRIEDILLGIIKSELKEYKYHVKDLESVTLEKKIFSSAILVKAIKMETFINFPGSRQGQIKMYIKRKDRDLAEQYVSHINLRISEHQLKQLEEDYI
jgi:hypothetical protein